MRKLMIRLAISLPLGAMSLALAGPVAPTLAQTDAPEDQSPDQLAIEGLNRLMQALDLLIQQIPQFEAPVIDENGDIIIRRKRTQPAPIPPQKPPETGSTST